MVSFITLLTLVFLVAAAAVITCVAIYERKRRQPTRPKLLGDTQPTVKAEKHVAPQEPQPPVVEEAEPTVTEEAPLTSVAETEPTRIHEAHLPAMAETQPKAVEEAQSTKAQEAQPIAEEASRATVQETQETNPTETQLTVIAKEIRTSRVEESQTTAVEEAQAIVAEETEPAVTKRFQQQETQQQETVKGQLEGAAKAVAEVKRGQRKPIKRGGKPRGPTQDLAKEPPQGTQARRSKPEIVCWKRERQWVLAVEVPDELLEKPGLTILQNGSSLPQDESEEACWRLERINIGVIVRWNEDEEDKIDLGREDYLLFKLSGQNLKGRRVRSPSSGSYLVIVPSTWERVETLTGPPPVTPEPTSLPDYVAHFFDLERGSDQKIAFRLPNGSLCVIESKTRRFELVGSRLEHGNEHMGPLFGAAPPRIRALDAQAWQEVGTIVIGEEGSGRGKWRMSFDPDPDRTEQDLPPEVADREGGWYFLRFYNNDDDLIETMDFRFLSVLREIRLPPLLHLPRGDGHKPICVELVHEADCAVQPVSNLAKIQVEHQKDKTRLIVPPDPACDESRWLVGPDGGPHLEVTINVERIWWAVGEESSPPSEWQDRPVTLSREDFKATSSKALWLRLPKRRWVDKVMVGFERPKARPYNVMVTEETVAIQLREFGDCAEVADQAQAYSLKLWIRRDHQDMEGTLAILPASQVSPSTQCWIGLGRKKTAVAKAVIQNGAGEIKVNDKPVDNYFRQTPRKAKQFLARLLDLKEVREALSRLEANISIWGSSPTTMRQAKAVAHAIARALMSYDSNLKAALKQAGFGGVKVKADQAGKRGNR